MIKKIKPLICPRCGKKLGAIKIKNKFYFKVIFYGALIALVVQLVTQFAAQVAVDLINVHYAKPNNWSWCC